MTIQRIFSLAPAVLPNHQPDRQSILLRSLFIGGVAALAAMRLTQQLNIRVAAFLGSTCITYCFESWRAHRVIKPVEEAAQALLENGAIPDEIMRQIGADLELQNALVLKLLPATDEMWATIWFQFCRLPELSNHLVKENALLAETMQKVFLGPEKADGKSHLLEPFLQGNEQLIRYLQTHSYFPWMETIHAAQNRVWKAIEDQEPAITGKLLKQPLLGSLKVIADFEFNCWISVSDAETAKALKEAKLNPTDRSLQHIAQNNREYHSTEFTVCDHASALIEAGASQIETAIKKCQNHDYLAGWMASYCFYKNPWSDEFADFLKTINKDQFIGMMDRSLPVDDEAILTNSNDLWTLFCKFNLSSTDKDSLFMRLIRLNPDRLPEWLVQAVSSQCPDVVEALLTSEKLKVSKLLPWKKRQCWAKVADIKTARILQENGLNVNEDTTLLETIASRPEGAAEHLRIVLACGRKTGVPDAIFNWERNPERKPLVAILQASIALHPLQEFRVTNWKAMTLEIYNEFCLLAEHEKTENLWKQHQDIWELICRFDDVKCALFQRFVDHASETMIPEMFDTAIRSKAPKVVSALLTNKKISVKDLSSEQQRLAWCGIQDAETGRVLKEHGFSLTEMSKEEVLALFEYIVRFDEKNPLPFTTQFQLLIDQGAQVDEPPEGWDTWIENIQDSPNQ